MKSPVVVAQSDYIHAQQLSKDFDLPFCSYSLRHFSCGESEPLFSHDNLIHDCDVILFYYYNRLSINDQLLLLLQIIQGLRERGAQKIHLLAPYLPYGRQDYERGYCNILQLLNGLGITTLLSVDFHTTAWLNNYSMVYHITADRLWADLVLAILPTHQRYDHNVMIISPDVGGIERATLLAKQLSVPVGYVQKWRDEYGNVRGDAIVGNVAQRTVILLDDMIDTGSTALRAVELLRERGAVKIIACFTHGIFSGSLEQIALLKSLCSALFVSDTTIMIPDSVRSAVTIVSTYGMLVKALSECKIISIREEQRCNNPSLTNMQSL